MLDRRAACLLALAVLAPAFAGCAEDAAPAARDERLRNGATDARDDGGTTTSITVMPKPPSQRWHFHDHWKGQPTLVLVNRTVTLNASQDAHGLPALSALVTLEPGVIVPPETGTVGVTVTWDAAAQGAINLTYRPADANGYAPAGDIENGERANITVTESMTDVPHRAHSLWAFNLTAIAGGTPPTLPPRDVHVLVTATIGRPLFIDPPHLDWWQDQDAIPLVEGATGSFGAARTPAANLTLPDPDGGATPADMARPARVPADEGRIVPEGAKVVVVHLEWTSEVPDQKLAVRYREANLPSEGDMPLAKDGATSRVFVVPVDPDQTDTTYSNRTTWEFEVLPEGDASAFRGTFTLHAWVARVEGDAALAIASHS